MTAQEKPKAIRAGDFIRDELYPGYAQAFGTQPFAAGPASIALRNIVKIPGA